MNRPVSALAAASCLLAIAGCSSSTDNGSIQIVTDDDAGTFTASPAVTKLSVLALSGDAGTTLASASLPASTIDLGTLPENDTVVTIAIQGTDATHAQRVYGASLPIDYTGLAGLTLPVFVQRDGQMAKLPGPLSGRGSPLLSIVQGEYLLVAGGSQASLATTSQLYDFGFLAALGSPPPLPVAPRSIALAGTVAWLIGDTTAEYFDFSSGATASLTLPTGVTPADIAGGATVIDPTTGAQYIVGATRTTGAATAKVLKVDPNDVSNTNYPYGNTTLITLSAPRLGAAAAWSTGYDLVVAGGSPTAAGVEVVMNGASGTALTQFPPDATAGAGMAPLDAQRMVVAGGSTGLFEDPGARSLDLGCPAASTPCAPVTSWGPLPVVLGTAQVFTFGLANDAVVIGNEIGVGTTHVFRYSTGSGDGGAVPSVAEVPTRVPHTFASAVWSPVGSIALFGGAGAIETFIE